MTSLPFCFESADVEITDRFAVLVQNADLPRKVLSSGLGGGHARDIVEITFVCEFHGPTN